MSTCIHIPVSTARFAHLHASFLAMVPRIVSHGQVQFRHIRCPLQREGAIAEMVALSWCWHVPLAHQGKDATQFVSALASYAARRVRSGGRLMGMEKSTDVLSPWAQRANGFRVETLPDDRSLSTDPLVEALHDNTQTAVVDQIVFRLDFRAWRRTRTERDRTIMDALMVGERPRDISRRHGLSPGRISQLRRDFHRDWCRFCGEPGETGVIRALKAFLDDLAAARLADRVVVLCFSEFGRTVAENSSGGTDHGTSGPVLLAGPS
jgi:Protein of unknown function (DUF1501)